MSQFYSTSYKLEMPLVGIYEKFYVFNIGMTIYMRCDSMRGMVESIFNFLSYLMDFTFPKFTRYE